MPSEELTSILQRLDKEIFYAVLDVAQDIDSELLVGADNGSFYIQGTRTVVRYPILYPGQSADAMYRYVDLRSKGLKFLQKHGFIEAFEYHKLGLAGFDGRFEVLITKSSSFFGLLPALRAEENRRNPTRKMESDIHSALARLLQLADSFHRVVLKLRERHAGRQPFQINDEYDVQDLFSALLETRFDDVRREEWGPSYAGRSTRVDFFLKNEQVLFETKMTRDNLTDRKVGEELIIDIAHYKQMPDCKALVCFVYDPEHRLNNPQGLENDLSKPTDNLDVRVMVRPKS